MNAAQQMKADALERAEQTAKSARGWAEYADKYTREHADTAAGARLMGHPRAEAEAAYNRCLSARKWQKLAEAAAEAAELVLSEIRQANETKTIFSGIEEIQNCCNVAARAAGIADNVEQFLEK